MAEWSNARAWKARELERVPGVRIPPSPPASAEPMAGRPTHSEDYLGVQASEQTAEAARRRLGEGGQERFERLLG